MARAGETVELPPRAGPAPRPRSRRVGRDGPNATRSPSSTSVAQPARMSAPSRATSGEQLGSARLPRRARPDGQRAVPHRGTRLGLDVIRDAAASDGPDGHPSSAPARSIPASTRCPSVAADTVPRSPMRARARFVPPARPGVRDGRGGRRRSPVGRCRRARGPGSPRGGADRADEDPPAMSPDAEDRSMHGRPGPRRSSTAVAGAPVRRRSASSMASTSDTATCWSQLVREARRVARPGRPSSPSTTTPTRSSRARRRRCCATPRSVSSASRRPASRSPIVQHFRSSAPRDAVRRRSSRRIARARRPGGLPA